jgi:hypothetical protein
MPVIAGEAGTPQAIYQAFRAQRRELGRQMEGLEDRRGELSRQLQDGGLSDVDKKGIEQRLTEVDGRISALDKAISEADGRVAQAAAIPGAAVDPPPPRREGPPEEVFVLGGIFIVVVLFPLAIAYARRIWRRGAAVAATLPKELMEKLLGLEQAVDSIAVEVERIGEGQRFMTRAFNEHAAPALGVGAAEPVEVKAADAARVRR